MPIPNQNRRRRRGDNVKYDFKEVLKICNKATEGPWETTGRGSEYVINKNNFNVCLTRRSHDAQFIALARTALPQLAEEVIKLRAVAEAAKGIEWVYGGDNLEGMWLLCPCCGKGEIDGHNDDCKLHQALVAAGYGGEE